MPYFGRGGQFGGWLQNPQFDFARGRYAKGIVPMDKESEGGGAGNYRGGGGQSGGGSGGLVDPRRMTGRLSADQPQFGEASGTAYRNFPSGNDSTGYSQLQYPNMLGMGGMPSFESGGMAGDQEFGPDQTGDPTEQARMDSMDAWMAKLMGGRDWQSKLKGKNLDVPDPYQMPEQWTQENSGVTEGEIDPMAVIKAAEPGIMEKMNRAMASGAARIGQTGAMMGSGYAKEIGKAARNASNDIASKTLDTLFQSSENQANRQQEANQNMYDRSLNSWQNMGNWGKDAWGKHGDWQLDSQKYGRDMEMSMIQKLLGMYGGYQGGLY